MEAIEEISISEPFIDLEAGLHLVEPQPQPQPELHKNTIMIPSDPKILTEEELQEIKNDIEKNINYYSECCETHEQIKYLYIICLR